MADAKANLEVNAMKVIDEALDPLEKDARARVLQWVLSKFHIGRIPEGAMGGEGSRVPKKAIPEGQSLKEFLGKKKPENNYERVACIVYYLENEKNYESIKTQDVYDANTEARQPKLSNASFFVRDAAFKYGYLTTLGYGKYGVSSRGESVVEALPDRDAVSLALEQQPFKRKKSGSKKPAKGKARK